MLIGSGIRIYATISAQDATTGGSDKATHTCLPSFAEGLFGLTIASCASCNDLTTLISKSNANNSPRSSHARNSATVDLKAPRPSC